MDHFCLTGLPSMRTTWSLTVLYSLPRCTHTHTNFSFFFFCQSCTTKNMSLTDLFIEARGHMQSSSYQSVFSLFLYFSWVDVSDTKRLTTPSYLIGNPQLDYTPTYVQLTVTHQSELNQWGNVFNSVDEQKMISSSGANLWFHPLKSKKVQLSIWNNQLHPN